MSTYDNSRTRVSTIVTIFRMCGNLVKLLIILSCTMILLQNFGVSFVSLCLHIDSAVFTLCFASVITIEALRFMILQFLPLHTLFELFGMPKIMLVFIISLLVGLYTLLPPLFLYLNTFQQWSILITLMSFNFQSTFFCHGPSSKGSLLFLLHGNNLCVAR